jgi:hypothetical protein
MNRSSGGMLALALLVAVWAGGSGTHSSPSSPHQSGKAPTWQTAVTDNANRKAGASAQASVEGPALSAGFRDESEVLELTIHDAFATKLTDQEQEKLRGLFTTDHPEAGRVGFMIALAPNPVRTHLSLIVDRTLDSLSQALQDSGYDFDRALLPWDNREHPESDNYTLRLGEEAYRRDAEKIPGILIFRRHPTAGSVTESDTGNHSAAEPVTKLLVFIVDDMPTSGVDRTQFEVALELGRRLTHWRPPQSLLILGPSFSGSLPSLNELLKAQAGGFRQVTIVSGTVAGKDSVARFERVITRQPPGQNVNFASFAENDKSLLNQLYRYACSQWRLQPREIAVISETETAFGRQVSEPVSPTDCPAFSNSPDSVRTPVTLHFPRGIYHIRTAYARQFPSGKTADDLAQQARSILRPNLEEPRASADTIPDFSSQSPVSQEAVLMGVVDELHRRQSHLVVLLASDSLDTLFLVRYLRKNYAYGQLVILSPDLLLRHEADEPAMRGILTLSPYSLRTGEDADMLHPPAFKLEKNKFEEMVFADDTEIGIYNAASTLAACLTNPELDWCHRPIGESGAHKLPSFVHLNDFGPSQLENVKLGTEPLACCRADIHLDTLGREGFWPVAALPADRDSWLPLQDSPDNPGSPTKDWDAFLPVAWKAVTATFLGCFAMIMLCLERASLLGSFEPELLLAPAGLYLPGSHGLKRRYLITFLCTIWTGLLAVALWPAFLPAFRGHRVVLGIIVVAVVLYAWLICILCRRYKRFMWPAHLLILLIVIVVYTISGLPGFRSFALQYVNISAGISPLLPLLLAGLSLVWWAWYNIAGSVFTDLRRPLLPRRYPDKRGPRPLLHPMLSPISAEEQGRLERVMGPAFPDARIWIPIAAVVFVVVLLIFPARPLRSMEHFTYDYLLIALLLFSFVLLLESALRGIMTWSDVRRLLRSIDSQPFSKMISRADGFSWTSIWKIGAGTVDSAHRLLMAEMDTLRTIQTKISRALYVPELFPALAVERVWTIYLALLERRRLGEPALPTPIVQDSTGAPLEISEDALLLDFRALQMKLADAAAVLLNLLQARYEQSPSHNCEPDKESLKKLRATPLHTFEELSEHYVSLFYINYIITLLLRIRTLAMAAVGIFVFDVLAVSSYPFEPRAILRAFMFTVFAALTICFGTVYAQMHRDRTLSRITDTKPEELGLDFWVRMLGVTGLPILTLVATEFPSVGGFLFSWIEPAMKALR